MGDKPHSLDSPPAQETIDGIIHFDATARRREKMRLAAGAVPDVPAEAAPVAPPADDTAELEKTLVNFVVEHTGYPPEVVELDADLEADLGIDSIKKMQLFGELCDHYAVPPKNIRLDSYPTLRHIVEFFRAARAGQKPG